jgi:hypothetical protein
MLNQEKNCMPGTAVPDQYLSIEFIIDLPFASSDTAFVEENFM